MSGKSSITFILSLFLFSSFFFSSNRTVSTTLGELNVKNACQALSETLLVVLRMIVDELARLWNFNDQLASCRPHLSQSPNLMLLSHAETCATITRITALVASAS